MLKRISKLVQKALPGRRAGPTDYRKKLIEPDEPSVVLQVEQAKGGMRGD